MTLVEFILPDALGGLGIRHSSQSLMDKIKEICNRHNLEYQTKIAGNRFRLTFNNSKHFTVFAMLWKPERDFQNYKILVQIPKDTN